jgi:dCMP deaminase
MPCSNCASLIAQTGIKRVVSINNDNPRWQESFKLSREIFKERGIDLKLYDNFLCDLLWV